MEVYLKEIVQREKQLRQRQESELQAAYERQAAEYQKWFEMHCELWRRSTKRADPGRLQIKKELEQAQLDSLLAQRRKVSRPAGETELEIKLQQATERQPNEARTSSAETGPASQPPANPRTTKPVSRPSHRPEPPPAQAPAAPPALNPLDLLTVELEFFEAKQAEATRPRLPKTGRPELLRHGGRQTGGAGRLRQNEERVQHRSSTACVERLAPDRIA